MSTRLLAEKNGTISIVEQVSAAKAFLVLRYIMQTVTRKVFLAEQGKQWELFINVEDAIAWIHSQNPPAVKPIRKIKHGSREWKKREKEVIDSYAPPIVACNNCGSPRHKLYQCSYCEKE